MADLFQLDMVVFRMSSDLSYLTLLLRVDQFLSR